jgi:tRNA nucleotidyltransferase (CCA-adding enzyme)
MARTSAQAFSLYLANLTPSATERQVAALHRQSLERALNQSLDVLEIRETGSFSHGTGLRGRSDVDLVVSLNSARPTDPSAALRRVRGVG